MKCADCGTTFDPGPAGAPIRCETCREAHNRTRPDRRVQRSPVTCADCGSIFQPLPKGHLPTRCPECVPAHRRLQAREAVRQRRDRAGSSAKRVRLDRSAVRCIDCGGPVGVTARGVPPKRCAECKRESLRVRKRAYDAKVREAGLQPWRKSMACLDCGVELVPEPGKRRNSRCDECRAKHRKPYQKDSAKNREKHLRRMYQMTAAEYDAMAESQGGRCAICGIRPEPPDRLHVDHSHAEKRVRALLCGSCNRMIGLAGEDRGILAAASKYLDDHRTVSD